MPPAQMKGRVDRFPKNLQINFKKPTKDNYQKLICLTFVQILHVSRGLCVM